MTEARQAMLAFEGGWRLWFIQLSGWPVFLACVVVIIVFMIMLSVLMTWVGRLSVIQAGLVATICAADVFLGILGLLSLLTRL